MQLPAVYYALKRHADYSPKGSKGEKTHISYAMRVSAIPAYVLTPDATLSRRSTGGKRSTAESRRQTVQLSHVVLRCPS